jgi:hypothetical protein
MVLAGLTRRGKGMASAAFQDDFPAAEDFFSLWSRLELL